MQHSVFSSSSSSSSSSSPHPLSLSLQHVQLVTAGIWVASFHTLFYFFFLLFFILLVTAFIVILFRVHNYGLSWNSISRWAWLGSCLQLLVLLVSQQQGWNHQHAEYHRRRSSSRIWSKTRSRGHITWSCSSYDDQPEAKSKAYCLPVHRNLNLAQVFLSFFLSFFSFF